MAADEIADALGPGRGERRKRGEPTRTVAIAPRWRVRAIDDRNWMLQEWREPDPSRAHRAKSGSATWRDAGMYFQTLLAACERVLEIELRRGGSDASLADAIAEMESIKESMCERIGNASLES